MPDPQVEDAPDWFRSPFEPVRPEWVDYNGHLNHAYYIVVFDHGIDVVLDFFDIGERYREKTASAMYLVESHICYLREVQQGEMVRAEAQVVDFDHRRLHLFERLIRDGACDAAATFEAMLIHVDGHAGRTRDFPDAIHTKIAGTARRHADHARPVQRGRKVGIRTKAKA